MAIIQSNLQFTLGGKTTVSGDASSTFTLGSVSCANLCAGMTNGQSRGLTVTLFAKNTSISDYSSIVWASTVINFATGPTYTLDTIRTGTTTYGGSGNPLNSWTLDISGGNLRFRSVVGGVNVDCWGVASLIGP